MNVFELATVASPLAGLVGGVVCCGEAGVWNVAIGGAVGLLVGFGIFPAPLLLASRIAVQRTGSLEGRLGWFVGTSLALYATAAPVVSWLLSRALVARLLQ
jgi:hypothetical protein